MIKASDLAQFLGFSVEEVKVEAEIHSITCKSSECGVGVVFAALRGEKNDGHNYIYDAYERGSRIFIAEQNASIPDDATVFIVDDSRQALALAALYISGDPQKKLKLIGVTGTKGKSTTVLMIQKILNYSGRKAVSSCTLGLSDGQKTVKTDNSTPESYILAGFLAQAVNNGATHAVIEVSSQGVKQHRIHGLDFDIGVMTNLSRDHIGTGEHSNFEEYKECKKRFFADCKSGVFNADDKYYKEFSALASETSYGISSQASIRAYNIKNVSDKKSFGITFDVAAGEEVNSIYLMIPGKFAVYDALAAISACIKIGVSLKECAKALNRFMIDGRFEKVETERDIDVVIDYAHNGASMKNALKTARDFARGKVICVFGSVGERTKTRRSELGKAVDKYSDFCVITSDNPNFEDPKNIADEIAKNIKSVPYTIIPDREEAIRYACDAAHDGDFILIAGKGHEKYQLIDGKKIRFDERSIITSASKIKANI